MLCSRTNLIKTNTVIRAANEAKLEVLGFIPISVQLVGHQDKKSIQALYITKQLKSLFLSRTRILELGCLPMSWPYPSHEADTCDCAPLITDNLAHVVAQQDQSLLQHQPSHPSQSLT